MPHHTSRTTTTTEQYESNSTSSSDSSIAVSELNNTCVYKDGIPEESRHTAQIQSSQNNVAMFQQITNQNPNVIEQNKDKESCCDCLISLFLRH